MHVEGIKKETEKLFLFPRRYNEAENENDFYVQMLLK